MCFVAIPTLKSHGSLCNDQAMPVFLLPGNPLAQDIMSLYQEPDGTRRLLNYLLDNLAGAIKRSKCPLLSKAVLIVEQLFYVPKRLSHLCRWGCCEMVNLFMSLPILINFSLCSVPTEQPPARSWISLQELDRTWPSGRDYMH